MEDSRGSSGIGSGKSIGLADGILLPAEAVESNRSRPWMPYIMYTVHGGSVLGVTNREASVLRSYVDVKCHC